MRALSIMQPWAWACAAGRKPLENRNWRLPPGLLGQRFAIHAGLSTAELHNLAVLQFFEDMDVRIPPEKELAFGAIVGVATIVRCVKRSRSPWFIGRYAFELKDAQALSEPIPLRGQLGFFTIPTTVAELVEQRLTRGAA